MPSAIINTNIKYNKSHFVYHCLRATAECRHSYIALYGSIVSELFGSRQYSCSSGRISWCIAAFVDCLMFSANRTMGLAPLNGQQKRCSANCANIRMRGEALATKTKLTFYKIDDKQSYDVSPKKALADPGLCIIISSLGIYEAWIKTTENNWIVRWNMLTQ